MTLPSLPLKLAQLFAMGVALSLLTTVAGINIFVLFLLPLGAWAWLNFKLEATEKKDVLGLFGLIAALCVVDVISNLNAGHALLPALRILLGDLRTFAFVIVLWPLFAIHNLSKKLFWTLVGVVVLVSFADLALMLAGRVGKQMYFLPGSGANMNGQILVGLFFVLAQILLQRPSRTWRIAIASSMGILMAGLFLASERRTGWVLLLAGAVVWIVLNRKQLLSKHAGRWLAGVAVAVTMVMLSSNVVHQRLTKIDTELQLFLSQSTEERITKPTSVGVRLQYDISAWQLAQESGWWGVGSLNFRDAFWRINGSVDGLQNQYSNPHNEYLYMLSTKGWLGLVLYLAIFAQVCRMAMKKTNEVQRISMLMMVFLFLLSITTNSMMTDMKEGHFAMLMMLVFLAPRELNLLSQPNAA
jgi:O-antigen ligase